MALGVTLGLVSGYFGGAVDALIMRIADVQLTFPAILVALLIDGIVRGVISVQRHDEIAVFVIVGAIGLCFWVQYARTVRGSVMVEKNKEYVQAARVIGLSPLLIMVRHVLPNVIGPVLVIATINLGLAIITEATLSFLGVGLPSTEPSLGTLIRIGNDFLLSGDWWITVFPGVTLAALVLAVNLLGDWLRDALNPEAAIVTLMAAASNNQPLLEVRNLRVEFPTRRGTLLAVDDVSFDIAPGEVLGVVGESGAGKSLTGTAIIGLLEPPGRIAGGEIRLEGRRIDNLPYEEMRKIRGARIGAIFQDPLTSLNPLYSVGHQLIETIQTHLPLSAGQAQGARDRTAEGGRHSRRRDAHRPLSAPVLRRHAPARGDRAGAVRRPAPDRRRRADDGARRLDPGADHRAPEAAVPRARHGGDAGHPRHGRDRRDRRPRRGDVCRPHRRDRPGARGREARQASLHQGPDGLDPEPRRAHRAADADRRRHAAAHRNSRRAAPSTRAAPCSGQRCLVERPNLMPAGATRAACWLHDSGGVGAPILKETVDA